jgi:hypothetical protein
MRYNIKNKNYENIVSEGNFFEKLIDCYYYFEDVFFQEKITKSKIRYVIAKNSNLNFSFFDFKFDKYISFNFFWNLRNFIPKGYFSKKIVNYFSNLYVRVFKKNFITFENYSSKKLRKYLALRIYRYNLRNI